MTGENRQDRQFRSIIEALLLYAALPAATMYPLGLLILWLQIVFSYGENLSTAWFAANLVPNSSLVGMGLAAVWDLFSQWRVWATLLLFIAIVVLLARVEYQRGAKYRSVQRANAEAERHVREGNYGRAQQHVEKARKQIEDLNSQLKEKQEEMQRGFRVPLLNLYYTGGKWPLGVLGIILLAQVSGWIYYVVQGRFLEAVSDVMFTLTVVASILVLSRDAIKVRVDPLQGDDGSYPASQSFSSACCFHPRWSLDCESLSYRAR